MTITEYLNLHSISKLQIGSGHNILPGWYNSDLFGPYPLDATRPFPIPDNSFDRIYSEHMIEHITYIQSQQMLSECYRILKPGGRIRISCPDLQFLIDMYLNPQEIHRRYMDYYTPYWAPRKEPIFVFNNFVRDWGHQFIYDRPTLIKSLVDIGFHNILEYNVRESADPNFQNLEIVSRMPEGLLQLETMTLEATK